MSTHFLNVNRLVKKDGTKVSPKIFARDRKTDAVIWLNFSQADALKVAAIHEMVSSSKGNGSHWTIDVVGLIDAVGEDRVDAPDDGNMSIATTAAQVLAYAKCVASVKPDPVDDEFAALLAAKAVPVESVDDTTEDPFAE